MVSIDPKATWSLWFRLLQASCCLAIAIAVAAPLPAANAQSDADLPIAPAGPAEVEEEEPPPPPEEDDPARFYDEDVPSRSDSVIFVIDRSASMTIAVSPFVGEDGRVITNGTRLELAKLELKRAIGSLPDTWTFNIVIYSECIYQWRPARQPATPQNKGSAFAYADAITPYGWTNTGGAVGRALADSENLAVVLLSDGIPNFLDCAQTYVADPDTHRRLILTANRQLATIDCFGLGLEDNPVARDFMRSVAADNHGTYREIR